jgi:hypothetical protein
LYVQKFNKVIFKVLEVSGWVLGVGFKKNLFLLKITFCGFFLILLLKDSDLSKT